MSDGDALLRAILAAPDDDAPRLIYADWLDEHGEGERAEFIRVQCELARTPDGDVRDSNPKCAALRRRERELFRDFRAVPNVKMIFGVWIGGELDWTRGFIHSITCTAADCLAHLDAIRERHPVQEVKLTTWPDISFGRHRAGNDGYEYVMAHLGSRTVEIHWLSLDTPEEHGFDAMKALWPGITFHLPKRTRYLVGNIPLDYDVTA